jgi:hypothetical protein
MWTASSCGRWLCSNCAVAVDLESPACMCVTMLSHMMDEKVDKSACTFCNLCCCAQRSTAYLINRVTSSSYSLQRAQQQLAAHHRTTGLCRAICMKHHLPVSSRAHANIATWRGADAHKSGMREHRQPVQPLGVWALCRIECGRDKPTTLSSAEHSVNVTSLCALTSISVTGSPQTISTARKWRAQPHGTQQ